MVMKPIEWSNEKNEWLKEVRGVSFQEAGEVIKENNLIDIINNPNQKKYPGQKIYVLEVRGYVWMVPFVEDGKKIFLKTMYPSRKYSKKHRPALSAGRKEHI